MQLARIHDVKVAPFFLVQEGDSTKVYTVFMRFLREVLQVRGTANRLDASQEIQRAHPELDLL